MKTKIKNLITVVLLSAASLTMLSGSPVPQPGGNLPTEPTYHCQGWSRTTATAQAFILALTWIYRVSGTDRT